jgi:hypothetical protein
MFGNETEVLKIQELLKKKFPNLKIEEIEKNSLQLMDLGHFLVRIKVEKHSQSLSSHDQGNGVKNTGIELE